MDTNIISTQKYLTSNQTFLIHKPPYFRGVTPDFCIVNKGRTELRRLSKHPDHAPPQSMHKEGEFPLDAEQPYHRVK